MAEKLTHETASALKGRALFIACNEAGVWEAGMSEEEAREALLATLEPEMPDWADEEETPEWAAEEKPETNPLWVWSWDEWPAGLRALIKMLPDRVEGIPLWMLERFSPREVWVSARNGAVAGLASLLAQADKDAPADAAKKPAAPAKKATAKAEKSTPAKVVGKKDETPKKSGRGIFDNR